MHATRSDGSDLSADFSITPHGDTLSLLLESAGGKVQGSDRPRNADYLEALTLLLRRLAARNAVILQAYVDSRNVQHLPIDDRSVIDAPVHLDEGTDPDLAQSVLPWHLLGWTLTTAHNLSRSAALPRTPRCRERGSARLWRPARAGAQRPSTQADTRSCLPHPRAVGRLPDHLSLLDGRSCAAHRPGTAAYFAWHRENKFTG
ncbi:hypothetical protein [Actinokineospora bangkokensis]|uniref:Uncharacterized protein n=1 Tax=Actinokineospora bangkokensis TaxID=1193682 RepID=A0A1Q9LSQ6_9PSEU|nr:hypothetical protein [Actinokineospora bangkokensis]OLR95031.1 hypothetical protein BJP25_08720 [Actinokineospora bangkokensis]